ncbi:MAG: hypothetical protein JWL89_615 [Candidatus Saccharibacteria bacterium]|nr:hypothetical protein [Candidatus Saccharibacteria bacterium]
MSEHSPELAAKLEHIETQSRENSERLLPILAQLSPESKRDLLGLLTLPYDDKYFDFDYAAQTDSDVATWYAERKAERAAEFAAYRQEEKSAKENAFALFTTGQARLESDIQASQSNVFRRDKSIVGVYQGELDGKNTFFRLVRHDDAPNCLSVEIPSEPVPFDPNILNDRETHSLARMMTIVSDGYELQYGQNRDFVTVGEELVFTINNRNSLDPDDGKRNQVIDYADTKRDSYSALESRALGDLPMSIPVADQDYGIPSETIAKLHQMIANAQPVPQ